MFNFKKVVLIAGVFVVTTQSVSFAQTSASQTSGVYANKGIEKKIDRLIAQMTVEEKASILIGTGMPGFNGITPVVGFVEKGKVPGAAGSTFALSRLGIPSIILSDGPAGLRISPTRPDSDATYYCTAWPVGTALASSWNPAVVKNVGVSLGNEVKEYGADVLLAPAINIHRSPLDGRNFEYYSEDPLISGEIAAAYINGVQSNGVGTSIKHFAANNRETNRMGVNEHISERAMREIYLRGFELAIKEAKPWTVMSSYNSVNGVFTSESHDLLTTILRDEWKFKGIVMTDWFGGYHGFGDISNPNYVSDVVKQETAGNDLLMPGLPTQKDALVKAMNDGSLPASVVNENLKRILELVFKSPSATGYQNSNKPDLKAHAVVAREAADECQVLLKNDGSALPVEPNVGPVAVFGLTSYNFIAGGTGSGDVHRSYTVSLIDGLHNAGYNIDASLKDIYDPIVKNEAMAEAYRMGKAGLLATAVRIPEVNLSQALIDQKAETDSLAIITVGRSSGEGADRNIEGDFNLASDEINLIDRVSTAFHAKGKKVIVILNIGGVIETQSWKDKVDAILLSWQLGQEGGNAVADIISGKVTPSGKLPMTFPVQYGDVPSAKGWIFKDPKDNEEVDPKYKDITYNEGVYVGYRYYTTFGVKPSYPFGYGLSYTTFNWSGIKLSSVEFKKSIMVKVEVKNTGSVPGKDVVELYLSAPHKNLDKPSEELKGFAKTKLLQPGETEIITLTLKPEDLASYDERSSSWIAEGGTYKVLLGNSADNILQTATFSLPHDRIVEKDHKAFAPDINFTDLKSEQ